MISLLTLLIISYFYDVILSESKEVVKFKNRELLYCMLFFHKGFFDQLLSFLQKIQEQVFHTFFKSYKKNKHKSFKLGRATTILSTNT